MGQRPSISSSSSASASAFFVVFDISRPTNDNNNNHNKNACVSAQQQKRKKRERTRKNRATRVEALCVREFYTTRTPANAHTQTNRVCMCVRVWKPAAWIAPKFGSACVSVRLGVFVVWSPQIFHLTELSSFCFFRTHKHTYIQKSVVVFWLPGVNAGRRRRRRRRFAGHIFWIRWLMTHELIDIWSATR